MMRFVHDVQVYKDPQKNYVFVRACCWASYKRDRRFNIKLTVQGGNTCTDKMKSASCDRQCPASKSECCCHLMAVIWKLEDMTRNGEFKECDNRTCMSKPQQYGKGGKREVTGNCSPVMTTSIVKPRHASDGPGKRKRGIYSQFYDPRLMKSRKIDPDSKVKLKKIFKRSIQNFHLLQMMLPARYLSPGSTRLQKSLFSKISLSLMQPGYRWLTKVTQQLGVMQIKPLHVL